MNETQHVSSQFDEDLSALRTHVLQMGGLVENQVAAAMAAYNGEDLVCISDIIEADHLINKQEKIIDDDCIQIIARRQPTASDLRLVFGITKIVTDLERVGDEAAKIARCVKRIQDAGHAVVQYGAGIRHIAESALNMVRQALDAFVRLDAVLATKVIRADDDVDLEFKAIIRQLITHMMEDPRTITVAIEIMAVARAVERMGDHAKNISEHVVYIVDGRDIRHPRKEEEAT